VKQTVAEQLAWYQERGAQLRPESYSREHAVQMAAQMRNVLEESEAASGHYLNWRDARAIFGEPASVHQCPAEFELLFHAFFEFWKYTNDSHFIVTNWPTFATAELGQSSGLTWADNKGRAAVLLNPRIFQLGITLGKCLSPYLMTSLPSCIIGLDKGSAINKIKKYARGFDMLAKAVLATLKGEPTDFVDHIIDPQNPEYQSVRGAISGSLNFFLVAHELAHQIAQHDGTKPPTLRSAVSQVDERENFESILQRMTWKERRQAIQRSWTNQESELEADMFAAMFSGLATGMKFGLVGPGAWLMYEDIIEYYTAFLLSDGKVIEPGSAYEMRIHAISLERDHPPPISRWSEVFKVIRTMANDPPRDNAEQFRKNIFEVNQTVYSVNLIMAALRSALKNYIVAEPNLELDQKFKRKNWKAAYPYIRSLEFEF